MCVMAHNDAWFGSIRLKTTQISALFGLAAGLAACASESGRERFEVSVVPILERHCLSPVCHGVGPSAEADGERIDWTQFHIRVTRDGIVADVEAAYAMAKSRINTVEKPEFSSLLRKPLSPHVGGEVHQGGVLFETRDSPVYQALRAWIAMESEGGEGGRIEDLSPNERQFADEVLPHLGSRQCMNASCHGPFAPFTAFQPPVSLDEQMVFPYESVVRNYAAAKMHIYLGGDPMLSRLIRKGLPFEQGGIAHRGGNDIFFNQGSDEDPRQDPVVDAIARWAEAEQGALFGGRPELKGIVFVRGPVPPGRPFSYEAFMPGSDIYILPMGAKIPWNLTQSAHPLGPADIRDPALSHDAKRVVFSMRISQNDAHNLYEIDIESLKLRALTHDAGPLPGGGWVSNVQPVYGPDGRVYFVSTRAGHVAYASQDLDTEIWATDPNTGVLERITHDPAPEAAPSFFGMGKSYGTLSFTVLRTLFGRAESAVFRMPLDHNKHWHGDPELHVHHGVTSGAEVVYAMRPMPDGRFASVFLSMQSVWKAGALSIVDRQMGPDLQDPAKLPSLSGFRHAFSTLAIPAEFEAKPVSMARHPVALPDGRLLVSLAHAPDNPLDAQQQPDFGIYALSLREDRETGAPVVSARTLWMDELGIADYDAEPWIARPLEDDPSHEWDWTPGASVGRISYRHVETLEAIMSGLPPSGPKPLRTDLSYARLIEALPVSPKEWSKAMPSLGVHGAGRILAEVPLEEGSFYLEVPANTPFRIQFLNAERMAVGAQHNRFIDVAPGQLFPGGVAPQLYPALCSGCHGSLSGEATSTPGSIPDTITGASITMATHEYQNPRRPKSPVSVGSEAFFVDFEREIGPMFKRSCLGAACHGKTQPAGALNLEAVPSPSGFDTAYEALLGLGEGSGGGRRYVDEAGASARNSFLMERLLGRELDAPRAVTGVCQGNPPLSLEEQLQVIRWIELGALYRGGKR